MFTDIKKTPYHHIKLRMKQVFQHSLLAGIMLFFCCSCNFLDEYPDSDANTEINTLDKIAEELTGAYPRASYFRFLELRTDNVADKGEDVEASLLNEAMYYWGHYDDEEVDSPKLYWLEAYRGIAQANDALEALSKYSDKTNPRVQALYAEAFLLRAYLHFMVANIWAKSYQGDNSDSYVGIVYQEQPEKNALPSYQISNLAEVYQKIERDLEYGLALVRDEYYDKKLYHFNKRAAYAFAARFYAFTAQWQKVVDYASYVIGNQPKKTISAYVYFEGMSESQLTEYYASEYNPSVLLKTTTESNWQKFYKSDRYGLSKQKYEQVFARANSKTLPQINGYMKTIKANSYLSRFYPKFVDFTSAEGRLNTSRGHYTENVLLSVDETILYRIEAYAMLERYDLAMNDMVVFANLKHQDQNSNLDITTIISEMQTIDLNTRNAIQPYYRPLNQRQASIIYLASELRQMQFMHEGLRWFDICRYNLAVDRSVPGEPRKSNSRLQPEDPRKILEFPVEIPTKSVQNDK